MKDFAYYSTVDLSYPASVDFNVTTWFKNGVPFAFQKAKQEVKFLNPADNGSTLEGLKTVVEKDKEAARKAIDNYWEASNKKTEEFKKDLFEDLGIEFNPKRDKLYSLAWSLGHSSGFSEVYNCACELVDLIQ